MIEPSALIQPHAAAIVATLVRALGSADPRAKLGAAKLLLRRSWGQPGAEQAEAVPAGGLSQAQLHQAVELMRTHLPLDRKEPNPAATSCPARQEVPAEPPADATRATTPCPAAERPTPAPVPQPDPSIDPMSRERSPSPLAAPPGTDPPRRDADPMSRQLLLARNSAEDAFRRPLPQPPDIEPPWPYQHDDDYRRRRWR
jgi:hypothetical protein